MRILVTGATGYIGGRLVPRLQQQGYAVRCLARAAERLRGRFKDDVEVVQGSVEDAESLRTALKDCDAAYYLIHSMASKKKFAEADRSAARRFSEAAQAAGVRVIIYLGGLGSDRERLSGHLRSRHEVGAVLRESGVPVIEFRAAQIIGSGSISFEMIRYLTERLPVMIAPRWVNTRCQPVAIGDVLLYLVSALELPFANRIYEIGGATVLTYYEMMRRYAEIRGLRRRIFVVPLFTPKLSSYWVHLITPIPARLAQPLIQGLYNEVIVRNDDAARDFPNIRPIGFDEAVRRALDRSNIGERETAWFDAFAAKVPNGDFSGVREGMLIDRRERTVNASPIRTAEVFASLGGERGWLAANSLWRLRGLLDRAVGGVGLRRGRRSIKELRVGDVVDFWRVEKHDVGQTLRLRAEMRLPGRAWLQFEAQPEAGGHTKLVQTAFYEPRGLWGQLYWYAILPLHNIVFGRLIESIARAAENRESSTAPRAR